MLTLLIDTLLARPISPLLVPLLLLVVAYVVYQRYFHPLAKYPGPFLASLTDLWQVYQYLSLQQPYHLTELHERHGTIVRYGPNKISLTSEDAIPIIYTKAGRSFPKTEFYDAFGGIQPNVFGTRDQAFHAVRRRHMAHSFSMASVKDMEPYMDAHIKILKGKIREHAKAGRAFDLKKLLQYYVVDVLFELAFSQNFGIQASGDEVRIPPVKEHTLLASATGAWTSMGGKLKKWLPVVPLESIQNLAKGRIACIILARESVKKRLHELDIVKDDEASAEKQRKDLLTTLILARDPDTGRRLTQTDLETEAFGFIIAGTHTTVATTTMLFWHLLHNPEYLNQSVAEIDASLPDFTQGQIAYSMADAEASLPFLQKCVKENFRASPIFTMPLERYVIAPEGVTIAGQHFTKGTSVAVCNQAFHHNPALWGDDHHIFDPNRWIKPEIADRAKLLMHFGLGNRQCIGKSMALANINKVVSTLLNEFEFRLADVEDAETARKGLYRAVEPPMISVGISDLDGPLMVVAKVRD